ncbi:MAG TPA: flavoprotein [Nocardioidaceae bacterium]|nr:flavoprotein [Nocardioidaceae bacterium]
MRNLSLIVCGAPLAARVADVSTALEAAGWLVTIVPTASARPWLDGDHSAGDFRPPDAPKPPRPDAVVVCPMTFNTGNKWIEGHADSRPLALLCESLGAGIPIVAVPFVNAALWAHPAWGSNLLKLQEAGVVLIDPATGSAAQHTPLQSGSGDDVSQRFDPAWLVSALRS